MKTRTLEQGIEDLKKLFEDALKDGKWNAPESGNQSFYHEPKREFFIDKRVIGRFDVLIRLRVYFKENVIPGYCVSVDPITLLWTTFSVIECSKAKEVKEEQR